MTGAPATRRWAPPEPWEPHDLYRNLRVLRRGPYDPACRVAGGTVWRATRTPCGPATLCLEPDAGAGEVVARAWGPGAPWALDGLPALLGADDDPSAFVPRHRLVAQAHRRLPGLRLVRTGLVLESLIPSILEQKVTTEEAYRAWRRLLRRHGEPAPGPAGTRSGAALTGMPEPMYVMPEPRAWALIPSWEWHRAGVDAKRSSTILRAVARARRLQEAAHMDPVAATARLTAIPGIGPWTAAETLQRVLGAADAVTVGDLHLPRIVVHALTGARDGDDERMLELLAPYAGQRHRATRLILSTGRVPPRRAPRFPRVDIARL